MRVWRARLRWLADRRAATAIMFALTITPILGFVALAVDVGSAVRTRAQLDLAADAAALTAALKGADDFAANPNTSLKPAQDAGTQRFDAQIGRLPGVSVNALSVAVTRNGNTITALVSYHAQYKTNFASLFGFPKLPADGSATTSRTNSPYLAMDIRMDDSSSMAIAASPSGMAQLGKLTYAFNPSQAQNQDCAFGCHYSATQEDFYTLARKNVVQLRIDVLTQAVQNVIDTVAGSAAAPQFAIGLYAFNAGFNTIFDPSTDLAAAAAAAGEMVVPVTTAGNDADTNIPAALQQITALTPAAGDGSTASTPRRFLFIVTDGFADYYDQQNNRVMAPLDPSECSALKAKGVQIMTLYTEYFPLEPPNVPPRTPSTNPTSNPLRAISRPTCRPAPPHRATPSSQPTRPRYR
jgi:Flp pilus assembly protein TadG